MSGKRKRTAIEEPPVAAHPVDGDGASGENLVIRVRRGALRRFDLLAAKSEGLPVEIKWDRRVTDRRAAAGGNAGNRRRGERRQKPPYTWEVADFLVVGDSSQLDEDSTPGQPRKKR
jgi:hypothetical protein